GAVSCREVRVEGSRSQTFPFPNPFFSNQYSVEGTKSGKVRGDRRSEFPPWLMKGIRWPVLRAEIGQTIDFYGATISTVSWPNPRYRLAFSRNTSLWERQIY